MAICRKVAVSLYLLWRLFQKCVLICSSLLPIGILRLCSIHQSVFTNNDKFGFVVNQIYAQVEISYNLIVASAPVLRVFLRAARTGVHDMTVDGTQAGRYESMTKASRSAKSGLGNRFLSAAHYFGPDIELVFRNQGENITRAIGGNDLQSLRSDNSETGIMVRQTVNVEHFDAGEAL